MARQQHLRWEARCDASSKPSPAPEICPGQYRLALKREALDPGLEGYTFSRPSDAVRFFQDRLGDRPQEVLLVVYLDARRRPILYSELCIGTANRISVDVQALLAMGLLARASGFVMGHNHPGGDPEPSVEDQLITRRLVQAGSLVGVQLLDHLIVGEDLSWVSLRQRGECELP